jgi:hypothetical protein
MDRLHSVLPGIVLFVAGRVMGSAGVTIQTNSEWKYSKWNKFVNTAVTVGKSRLIAPAERDRVDAICDGGG